GADRGAARLQSRGGEGLPQGEQQGAERGLRCGGQDRRAHGQRRRTGEVREGWSSCGREPMRRMLVLAGGVLAIMALSWACRTVGKAVESVGNATGIKAVSDLGKVIESGEELSPSEQYYVGRSVSANIIV